MKNNIIIKQCIAGIWVELIKMPMDGNPTNEEIEKGLEDLKEMIFDSDKVSLVLKDEFVIFSRKDGPIRVTIEDRKYLRR